MSELESLALLIAELSTQNRALHQENTALREELRAERERERQRESDSSQAGA